MIRIVSKRGVQTVVELTPEEEAEQLRPKEIELSDDEKRRVDMMSEIVDLKERVAVLEAERSTR